MRRFFVDLSDIFCFRQTPQPADSFLTHGLCYIPSLLPLFPSSFDSSPLAPLASATVCLIICLVGACHFGPPPVFNIANIDLLANSDYFFVYAVRAFSLTDKEFLPKAASKCVVFSNGSFLEVKDWDDYSPFCAFLSLDPRSVGLYPFSPFHAFMMIQIPSGQPFPGPPPIRSRYAFLLWRSGSILALLACLDTDPEKEQKPCASFFPSYGPHVMGIVSGGLFLPFLEFSSFPEPKYA